jgi:hypothetical protein
MEKEKSFIRQEIHIKGSFLMENITGKENIFGIMEIHFRVNIKKVKNMDSVYISRKE